MLNVEVFLLFVSREGGIIIFLSKIDNSFLNHVVLNKKGKYGKHYEVHMMYWQYQHKHRQHRNSVCLC